MFSSAGKIASGAWKIISVPEKTVSLTNLIFDAVQLAGSNSWKIAEELEMIVFMKEKTTGAGGQINTVAGNGTYGLTDCRFCLKTRETRLS
jgi:hypothetical protein